MSVLSKLDPDVDSTILLDIGERKVAETGKHWVVTFLPWVRVVIGGFMIIGAITFDGMLRYALLLLAAAIIVQALWRIVEERRDRFVITNQRIFRVWGMLHVNRVSVPLLRILDITVSKTLPGRVFNYGDFVFKSAAEVEGLSLIDHVPNIDQRGHSANGDGREQSAAALDRRWGVIMVSKLLFFSESVAGSSSSASWWGRSAAVSRR